MAERKKLPDRYTCECGEEHLFSAYVYAHWDLALVHTCNKCGRQNTLEKGEVIHVVRPTKKQD